MSKHASRWKAFLILSFLVWAAFPGAAQTWEDRVVEHTLANGLQILLVERPQAPVVSLNMCFRAGGVDEVNGLTGCAHLLEHMLFKGTKTIGTRDFDREKPVLEEIDRIGAELDAERARGSRADPEKIARLAAALQEKQQEHQQYVVSNEFDRIYSTHGGTGLNAGTSKDFTMYFISLPANKLELWAVMEADRMKNAVLREFYHEREVVKEERRQDEENDPGAKLAEAFYATAFLAHPYRLPTIGWMSDLEVLPKAEVERFFREHYIPNNATVAIVGDIDPPAVIEMLEKYFADIPAGERPREVVTKEPPQSGERRVEIVFDAQPRLTIGYHKPTAPHRDDYVLDVVSSLLSSGRTSRFYRHLVEEQQVAVSATCWNGSPGVRYDNLFVVSAVPRHPHTCAELEQAIYAEIESLKTEPVGERELQKVRNQVAAEFIRGLASNHGLAQQLAYTQALLGDWRYLVTYSDRINSVTAEEIQQTVQRYFTPRNRTVATLVKKEDKADAS